VKLNPSGTFLLLSSIYSKYDYIFFGGTVNHFTNFYLYVIKSYCVIMPSFSTQYFFFIIFLSFRCCVLIAKIIQLATWLWVVMQLQ